jgi:hypothetical protein
VFRLFFELSFHIDDLLRCLMQRLRDPPAEQFFQCLVSGYLCKPAQPYTRPELFKALR